MTAKPSPRIILLAESVRLTPDDESALRWYFTEADGDLGLRSSAGSGERSYEPADWRAIEAAHGRIYAVERWRQVAGVLAQVGRDHQRVLHRLYSGERWDGLGTLGRLAGVVLLTRAARRALTKAAGRGLGEQAMRAFVAGVIHRRTDVDKALLSAVRNEAEVLVEAAAGAYVRARERAAEPRGRRRRAA